MLTIDHVHIYVEVAGPAYRLPLGGQIPDEYLYETLGLYTVPRKRSDLPRAKI